MIRHYELIDKVKSYNPSCDVGLINKAYVFSMRAHGNQKRASGQPYLIHPLEVASILADLKLDDASICVGLLHDTVEDTLTTYDEIKDIFGREIADLVDGVTKLSQITFNTKAVEQAENFRKMFLAMSKDIRVLLVKLADRLHNMRTMEHISSQDKRRRKAQETIDIYAPLADRIGLYAIKSELEDLSFKEINPDEYQRISRRLDEFIEKEELVDKVAHELKDELRNHGFPDAYIKGRAKTIYSIYRKMVKKNLTFDQLTDIVAYRVVMEDDKSCYEILGMIHSLYKAIPGRFKDYISNPKPNGYQSLHTSVIGPFGNRMEVQIRTTEMDEVSEIGVAAHWLYKQADGSSEGSQYAWLRKMLEMLNNTDDPEEFLENTKLDLFKEHVFVFTPKGDLVSLPVGATPLDFAYEVHSEVGHRCQAAKINGRVVPLRARLNNGDQIEVITNKGQEPSPAWRDFVVTGKARAAINRYLRSKEQVEHLRLGREMLDKYLKKEGLNLKDADLKPFFEKYRLKDLDDAYVGIAQGRVFPKQLVATVFPDLYKENLTEKAQGDRLAETTKSRPDKEPERDLSVGIQGLTPGISIHFGKCCNPLPGEPIVGIINTGRGVTVHTKMCKNLTTLSDQPDRWISLNWDGEDTSEDRVYVVRVKVQLAHEPGALSNFSTAVFNGAGNIVDLHIERRSTDTYEIRTDIEVRDILHYEKIIAGLKALSCVTSVERAQ